MTERQKPELAFIGYATVDVNVTPVDKTTMPGGAAYFGALAASRLMSPVGLVTRVGDDYDPSNLPGGVSKKGIKVMPGQRTARSTQTYFSDSDYTNRDISVEWGVAVLLEGDDIPKDWLAFLKTIHIATMIPTQQYAILEYIRKYAPQAKISIDTDSFLLNDPGNLETIRRSFEQSDIGFVNRKEYEILGKTIDRMSEAVVKLDQDGAFYMQNGTINAQSPAEKVSVVDVTGAGDIFAGTFLSCILLNYSQKDALSEATKTATKSVTKKGITHLFE